MNSWIDVQIALQIYEGIWFGKMEKSLSFVYKINISLNVQVPGNTPRRGSLQQNPGVSGGSSKASVLQVLVDGRLEKSANVFSILETILE